MKRNTINHPSPFLAVIAGLAFATAAASAQTTLFTEDFEAPVVTGYSQGTTPTGWVRASQGFNSSYHGLINEDVDTTPAVGFEDPVGAQGYAFRYTNSGLTSAAGVIGTLQLGVTYTVSVDVVKDIVGTTGTPYSIQLIAFAPGAARDDCRSTPTGSVVLNSKTGNSTNDGSYSTATFTFTAGCAQASIIGYDLGVRFIGASDSATVDNVSVSADYSSVAYWDTDGSTAGPGGASPNGTWSAASTNWNPLPDGTGTVAAWTSGRMPVFAAGTDATGSYTVTVDGTQNISGLIHKEGTLTLANGTSGTLNLATDSDFIIATGLSATIGVPLTDTGVEAFEKCGSGTLVLTADNSGATGPVNISAGTLQVESASSLSGGTGETVTLGAGGVLALGASYGAGNIPATLDRIVTTSAGAIAADNFASTAFDFNTPGLTAASLGAVGSVNYTGALTPNGTNYRLGGGGGTLTMANANALTGAGKSAIIKGNVTLAASNDLDSGVTLSSGVLTLGNAGSLGTGTLTIAGAGTLAASGTVVASNVIAANSDFSIGGTGALTLGGDMTLSANRAINNTNTTAATTLGNITGTNRSLTFNGNGDTTVGGNITTGTQGLTKNGAGILTLSGANTYSGTTTASGGTLVLSGSNSSAGATTVNAATLQLNSASNGGLASGLLTISQNAGVLQAVNADRAISNNVSLNSSPTISGTQSLTINGTMTVNNNRTLTNSISGTGKLLTFSNITRDGSNNRNLAFSGDGNTTVNGTLVLGSGTLTKNGNGTLILNGTNTYTGTTTVNNGGTLLINGDSSASTGTVTVNSTATLGGSGTIGGNVAVTASANLAPGASVGTLAINGNLTISAMAGGAGLLNYELNTIAASDKITAGGTLDIGTAALGLSDFNFTNLGGLQNGTYTLIQTGSAITGTLAGDTNGTLGLATIDLQISGDGTDIELVVSGLGGGGSPYTSWASTNAPTGNPNDDYDGDGVSNAVEFVLGGLASTNDLDKLPAVSTSGGNLLFSFERDQDSIDASVSVEIEVGTDLASWPASYTVGADTAGSDAGVSVSQNDPATGTDTVTLSVAQGVDAKKFARLKVVITL